MKLYDLAVVEEIGGSVRLHRADCPMVRTLAALGQPVMTMFGCESMPDMLPRHVCLTNPEYAETAPSAAG